MIRIAFIALLAGVLAIRLARARRGAIQVLRISRVVADLGRAEAFYRDALGFHRVDAGPCEPWLSPLFGLPAAKAAEVVMRLGADEVALVQFDPPGPPYPADSRSNDLWFQHLAIVVADMEAAYRLVMAHSPVSISKSGPQTLPPRNGEVTAFKFRDPDGHPLELIHFPHGQGRDVWQRAGPGPFLGIDHSALAISATSRSLNFYRRLGMRVGSRSLNHGTAQSCLDGLPNARVRITGLRPAKTCGPGLELLGYRPPGRPAPCHLANAQVTDWVTIHDASLRSDQRQLLNDPDGHALLLIGRSYGATAPACEPLT